MSKTSERRARRVAQRRKQEAGSALQNRWVWLAGGALLVVVAIAVLGFTVFSPSATQPSPGPTTPVPVPSLTVPIGQEVSVPSMGGQHVEPGQTHAAYNSTPPTSGPHYSSPANWGKYDNGLPEETWIHNMEHGGVVFLWNCPQGCPELTSTLEALLKDRSVFSKYGYAKFIMVPYTKIPNKLTLVAWNYYLPLNDYDDAAVRKFIKAHQDNGPEDVG
jgi:hypothetical protein